MTEQFVRVVQVGGGSAAALAGALFVATGAEVVQVDVDGTPPASSRDRHLARGKRRGHLVTPADVVLVEAGSATGELADAAAAAGPLVVVEITPFGRVGPRSSFTGGSIVTQASGGYAALCADPSGAPSALAGDPFGHLTGVVAYLWSLAALRSGAAAPVRVDLSIEDTVAANLEYALPLYAWMGLRKRAGMTYPFAYPHDLFAAADGLVELTMGTRDAMLLLSVAVDEPGLAEVAGLDTEYQRALAHDAFDELVGPALARMTRAEFFARTTELRMPTGYVTTPTELAALPPVAERRAIAGGDSPWPRWPLTPVADRGPDADAPPAPMTRPVLPAAAGNPAPLAGVRVVDFTLFYAGATTTRILAELGAEVLRVGSIQSPGRGLGLGMIADFEPGPDPWNASCYYYDRLAGKQETTLDLSTEAGMALLHRLLADSDVFVTNYSPRALAHLGLGADELQARHPRLVVSQISGYGASGPWKDLPAVGPGIEALAGVAWSNRDAEGRPTLPGTAIADAVAGYWAAAAALRLLLERDRTGGGGAADISMLEGCLAIFPEVVLDPEVRAPGGIRRAGDDRWLAVDAEAGPVDPEAGAAELEAQLQAAGVPAALVRDARDLVADPHLWARGTLEMVEQPGRGRRPMPRQLPGVCADLDVAIRGRAPLLGEHNDEVLGERLGLAPDELAALEAAGVIGTVPAAPWDGVEVLDPGLAEAAGLTLPFDPGYRELSEGAGRPASPARPASTA